jgi:hypothetical protein
VTICGDRPLTASKTRRLCSAGRRRKLVSEVVRIEVMSESVVKALAAAGFGKLAGPLSGRA